MLQIVWSNHRNTHPYIGLDGKGAFISFCIWIKNSV